MSDVLEILIKAAASVVITSFLPGAMRSLRDTVVLIWRYVVHPALRFASFPVIRLYRDKYKKYEFVPLKFHIIESVRQEFFFDWYRWVRYGGRYPMSSRETRRFMEHEERLRQEARKFDRYIEEEGISK